MPIFEPGRITLQQVRHNSPTFNAALVAFVEAHRDDDAERNRLCPPNPYASELAYLPGMLSRTWVAEGRWLREPDVMGWVGASRLNLLRGLPERASEPEVRGAVQRFVANVGAAIGRLREIDGARAGRAS